MYEAGWEIKKKTCQTDLKKSHKPDFHRLSLKGTYHSCNAFFTTGTLKYSFSFKKSQVVVKLEA